ncbi:MAG: glycoside hydrolase family 10 protein [bacterium]
MGQFDSASATQPPAQTAEPQFRAYWVDSFGPGLYTEAEIDQLVADTKAANLNAIVAQVVRRADCLCNRSILPRTTEAEIDALPFDPLQTLIDKAHSAGIEVHAWLNATIMWALDTPPPDPSHVFHTHGPAAQGSDNWVMRRQDGAIRGGSLYYFDPGHPDAAAYIESMFLSIVGAYDVDGIHFDFVRYPDYNPGMNIPAWGYNPVAVTRFQVVTGRTDVPAPTDLQWMQWRRDQVTNIVRRVYLETYALKPRVRVSAATIAYGSAPNEVGGWTQTRSYIEVLQDWRAWMEEGILDLNIPMIYRREQATMEPNNHRRMYEEWSAFSKDHQYKRTAAIGTGLYLNPIEDSVAQIRKALTPSPAGNSGRGWVGFSYRNPDALATEQRRPPDQGRVQLARALTQPTDPEVQLTDATSDGAPFATPAPIPAMPWKLQPTQGHVNGRIRTPEGEAADAAWVDLYSTATGSLVASARTDGSGWFGFIDLSPGQYEIRAGASAEAPTTAASLTIVPGSVTPLWLIIAR